MQIELEALTKKFKDREEYSLTQTLIPEDKFLIIRLDGFKASRNLLRDVIVNKKFNSALQEASLIVYFSFRNYLTKEFPSSIINVIIFNDEISFVLNKDNEHKDAKRIMKVCTLFAGMLSGAVTQNFVKAKNKRDIISFDARPIIVSKDEIPEYIRYRSLVATRYAYWKILRLNNIEDCYEDYVKGNIENSIKLCKKHNLVNHVKKILESYKIYFPEKTLKPKLMVNKLSNINIEKNKLLEKIDNFIDYQYENRKSMNG